MRHRQLLAIIFATCSLSQPLPVRAQYDDFELPPGIENTVIPKRLRQHNTLPSRSQSASDIRQLDSYRSTIEKYYQLKDYALAEPVYKQYVALLEKIAPDSEPLAQALENFAQLESKLQNEAAAQAALARAQAIKIRVDIQAKPYGLKEYRLGMSLDDFAKLTAAAADAKTVKGICSCDADQTVEILPEADRAAKVIQCGLWDKDEHDVVTKPHAITVAGIQCTPDFRFIQLDGIYRLFEISITFYSSNFEQMKDALTTKYGQPQAKKQANTHTGMGNNFPVINLIWDNGLSKIKVANTDGSNFGRATLRYLHTRLAADYAGRISEYTRTPVKQAADDL